MSLTNYEFNQGDSWPFTLDTITDLTGASVTNLASWGCTWKMRSIITGNTVATASTGAGTITRGSGFFTWIVPSSTTDNITPDVYLADAEVTDASGNKQTFTHSITVMHYPTT